MYSKYYNTHIMDEAEKIDKDKGRTYFMKHTNFLATYNYLITCSKDEFVCTMYSLWPDYPVFSDEEFKNLVYRWDNGVF